MRVKVKPGLVALGLMALFLPFILLLTNSLQADELQSNNEIISPASPPQKDRLTLTTVFSAVIDEEVVGFLAVYDDITTERSADYVELYGSAGRLLVINWFDQFGIERVAVNRSLLEPGQKEREGVFVLILEGDPA